MRCSAIEGQNQVHPQGSKGSGRRCRVEFIRQGMPLLLRCGAVAAHNQDNLGGRISTAPLACFAPPTPCRSPSVWYMLSHPQEPSTYIILNALLGCPPSLMQVATSML